MDLTERERESALAKVRAAWHELHPDAAASDAPAALRAAEDEPEERPTKAYLAALRTKLKELLGIAIPEDDWDAAHRSAMSSAGGKASAAAKARAKQQASAFAEPGTGFLVALWLSPSAAERLALAGGEPAEALHVTLAYCGPMDELDELTVARAIARIEQLVSYRAPLAGVVAGYGRFAASPTSDAQDVFYAVPDVPGLAELRQGIVDELAYAGLPPRTSHGYTPHITLAYLDPGAPNPVEALPQVALRFAAVTIMAGPRRLDIPLGGFGPTLYSTAGDGGAWRLFVEQPQAFAAPPASINVLPVPGIYSHPTYGTIAITAERNERFVANFEARVYQQDLPIAIDIEHDGKMSGAVGYIEGLRQNPDGSVEADVRWTERGAALIEADAFRYFSPEWFDVWREPASGAVYEDVLIGGAICVRPFFKENALRPLVASEGRLFAHESPDGGQPVMLRPVAASAKEPNVSDKEKEAAGITLSAEQAQQFAELQAREAEREKALAEQTARLAELEAAKTASDEKIARLEAEAQTKRFTDLVMGRGEAGDGAVWPGAIDQSVKDLVRFAEVFGEDSDQFREHVAHMQSVAKSVKGLKAFEPIGSSEGGEGGSAWDQIEAKAKAYAEEHKVTKEAAIAAVAQANPDLYRAYRQGE